MDGDAWEQSDPKLTSSIPKVYLPERCNPDCPSTVTGWLSLAAFPQSSLWLREMCWCTGNFSHPFSAPQCPPVLVLGHSQVLPVLSNVALPWRPALERKSGACWEPLEYPCSVCSHVCPQLLPDSRHLD